MNQENLHKEILKKKNLLKGKNIYLRTEQHSFELFNANGERYQSIDQLWETHQLEKNDIVEFILSYKDGLLWLFESTIILFNRGISLSFMENGFRRYIQVSWKTLEKVTYQIHGKTEVEFNIFTSDQGIQNFSIFFLNSIQENQQKSGEALLNIINTIAESLGNDIISKLQNLVGLKSVKEELSKLISTVKVNAERVKRGMQVTQSALHMVFTGNPGTGKTTVARILARAYKEIGILSKGHLVETTRSELVEKYVGHSAKKTEEIVHKAFGGVLFIDEAYALANGGDFDFGQEVIDTLVPLMDNNREKLVVIVAGYPKEMNIFLDANTGLASRFPNHINFKDYDTSELIEIFKIICKERGYKVPDLKTLAKLEKMISLKNQDKARFGNGRGIRNLFERIEKNQKHRIAKQLDNLSDEALMSILDIDIF